RPRPYGRGLRHPWGTSCCRLGEGHPDGAGLARRGGGEAVGWRERLARDGVAVADRVVLPLDPDSGGRPFRRASGEGEDKSGSEVVLEVHALVDLDETSFDERIGLAPPSSGAVVDRQPCEV